MAEYFVPADLCEDLICCVICYEPFAGDRLPKALPCLHTFCVECLQNTIHSHERSPYLRDTRNTPPNFPCPVCKEPCKVPSNGLAGFKDDFRIRKISEMIIKVRSPVGVDRNIPEGLATRANDFRLCQVCRFFNKRSDAPLYCLECNKLLCESCSEKHLSTPIACGHKIVTATQALLSDSACKLHETEALKYYCRTCEKAVCTTCTFTADHVGHDVTTMEDESRNIKKKLSQLVDDSEGKMQMMDAKLSELDRLEERLHHKERLVYKAILSRTFEEISRARTKQSKMETELEELQQRRQQLKDEGSEMSDCCDFTRTILERGQDVQVVGLHVDMREKLARLAGVRFRVAPEEKNFVNLGKYDALVEEQKADDETQEDVTQASIMADIKNVVAQMRMLSLGRPEINLAPPKCIGRKGTADGEFNFPSGVAVLLNGDIAVADMHNSRVQIFDPRGKFKSTFGHAGFKPCGIAVTKEGHIAVTDCKAQVNCIKIFTPEGERRRQIGLGEFDYPFSIAVDSKNRFIVSDPAVSKIIVLNPDGTVYRKFSTKSKFTFYLTVNSRDDILVSDWYNHCVKVFDVNGKLLRTIGSRGWEDGRLMIPLGICSDRRCNVLILDCKCERVSLFTSDGRFLSHIIDKDKDMQHSRAMTLSKDGRLIITRGDNKRGFPNEIRIYQI